MFEFAISQHRKRRPSRRWLTCLVVSVFAHVAAVGVLVENPSLLRTGQKNWLRHLMDLRLALRHAPEPKDSDWRTVAVVGSRGRMQPPSEATLKALAYDWSKGSGSTPPITIKLDKGLERIGDTKAAVRPVTPALGTQEPQPVPGSPTGVSRPSPTAPETPSRAEGPAGGPVDATASKGGATGETPGAGSAQEGVAVALPPPEPPTPQQVPKNIVPLPDSAAPTQIPDKPTDTKQAANANPEPRAAGPNQIQGQPKVFENVQQA